MADREQMTDEWLADAFGRAMAVSGDTVGNLLRGFANRVLQSFGDGKALREALDIGYDRHLADQACRAAGEIEFASWAPVSQEAQEAHWFDKFDHPDSGVHKLAHAYCVPSGSKDQPNGGK